MKGHAEGQRAYTVIVAHREDSKHTISGGSDVAFDATQRSPSTPLNRNRSGEHGSQHRRSHLRKLTVMGDLSLITTVSLGQNGAKHVCTEDSKGSTSDKNQCTFQQPDRWQRSSLSPEEALTCCPYSILPTRPYLDGTLTQPANDRQKKGCSTSAAACGCPPACALGGVGMQ